MQTDSGVKKDRERSEGFFVALKLLLANLIGIVQTRLELLGNELQEEKMRLISLLIYIFGAVAMLIIGLVFFLCLLVVLLWDQRIVLFGVLCAGFLVSSGALTWLALRQVRKSSRLFTASLSELKEDIRQLRATRPAESFVDNDINGY